MWLFSSGPVGSPVSELAQGMAKDPVELAGLRIATHARDHRMFAGKLDRRVLSHAQRASLLIFHGLEGDFRDWAEIRQWARDIAEAARSRACLTAASAGDPTAGDMTAGGRWIVDNFVENF